MKASWDMREADLDSGCAAALQLMLAPHWAEPAAPSASPRVGQVLGAGGSARAAVWALLDAGASDVWIWNRSPERAATLAVELGGAPVSEPVSADLLTTNMRTRTQRMVES